VVEATTVRSLLRVIEARLARLEEAVGVSLADYRGDRDLQDIVERNFEIMIQACIDLGLHVLADEPRAVPDSAREVFGALGEAGFLDGELAGRLESMAGFRNVLAHVYAEVDPALVHANLERLDDVRDYVAALAPALRRRGVEI